MHLGEFSQVLVIPIILGNVLIFATTPPLTEAIEKHHTTSETELWMCAKMIFFQARDPRRDRDEIAPRLC